MTWKCKKNTRYLQWPQIPIWYYHATFCCEIQSTCTFYWFLMFHSNLNLHSLTNKSGTKTQKPVHWNSSILSARRKTVPGPTQQQLNNTVHEPTTSTRTTNKHREHKFSKKTGCNYCIIA